MTPSSIASGDEWPTLTWSVSGDATVRVKGPAGSGFERDTRSGSEQVCPAPSSSEASACDAEPGTYTYTVRVPATGASIEERSVVLTVSDAGAGPS